MLRSEFQKQLAEAEAFIASSAFPRVQQALRDERAGLEMSILSMPPTLERVAELNQLHGKLASVISQQTYFEDLCDALKTEIARMDESGNIVTETT